MKINEKIINGVIRKLEKACIPDDTNCRMCANGAFGFCPHDKAYEIRCWWEKRKK